MNKKQKALKALDMSIDHWKKVVRDPRTLVGPYHCELCLHFNHGHSPCMDCPVRVLTRRSTCKSTPYNMFCNARTTANANRELSFLYEARRNWVVGMING